MVDLFLLSPSQMRGIKPLFPLSHGVQRVISGIIYVIKNGLRWRDAPIGYGPHKTLYNRFVRWSRMGVFNRIFAALAERSFEACIPSKRNRKQPTPHDTALYRQRYPIENTFGRLKDWRRIETRYDQCAHTFFSTIPIKAIAIFCLKNES